LTQRDTTIEVVNFVGIAKQEGEVRDCGSKHIFNLVALKLTAKHLSTTFVNIVVTFSEAWHCLQYCISNAFAITA